MKKTICISALIICACCHSVLSQTNSLGEKSTNSPSLKEKMEDTQKRLIIKYDLNHNGKIDVSERKEYVRERANLMQEFTRQESTNRTNSAIVRTNRLGDSLFSVGSGREILAKYDVNKNGRLDKDELQNLQQDRLKELKERRKEPTEIPSKFQVLDSGLKKSKTSKEKEPSNPLP